VCLAARISSTRNQRNNIRNDWSKRAAGKQKQTGSLLACLDVCFVASYN
jgi:hypothetical protein